MTPQNPSAKDANKVQLPPVGRDVRVRHNGRERLAYRDSESKWRDPHDGSVLQGEVVVLKVE
jgi:hypothetical protein